MQGMMYSIRRRVNKSGTLPTTVAAVAKLPVASNSSALYLALSYNVCPPIWLRTSINFRCTNWISHTWPSQDVRDRTRPLTIRRKRRALDTGTTTGCNTTLHMRSAHPAAVGSSKRNFVRRIVTSPRASAAANCNTPHAISLMDSYTINVLATSNSTAPGCLPGSLTPPKNDFRCPRKRPFTWPEISLACVPLPTASCAAISSPQLKIETRATDSAVPIRDKLRRRSPRTRRQNSSKSCWALAPAEYKLISSCCVSGWHSPEASAPPSSFAALTKLEYPFSFLIWSLSTAMYVPRYTRIPSSNACSRACRCSRASASTPNHTFANAELIASMTHSSDSVQCPRARKLWDKSSSTLFAWYIPGRSGGGTNRTPPRPVVDKRMFCAAIDSRSCVVIF
mmetsp:Transcript_80559/g.184507  ORF Transcript_80559/g.184507 Transcript_80559/m.184507 type:complete len:395 (-) Transcript_80559:1534-2718(-)